VTLGALSTGDPGTRRFDDFGSQSYNDSGNRIREPGIQVYSGNAKYQGLNKRGDLGDSGNPEFRMTPELRISGLIRDPGVPGDTGNSVTESPGTRFP